MTARVARIECLDTGEAWVKHPGTGALVPEDEYEDPRETVALAVESAWRWAARTDLSPELRLRRIWTVLEAAIREEH